MLLTIESASIAKDTLGNCPCIILVRTVPSVIPFVSSILHEFFPLGMEIIKHELSNTKEAYEKTCNSIFISPGVSALST